MTLQVSHWMMLLQDLDMPAYQIASAEWLCSKWPGSADQERKDSVVHGEVAVFHLSCHRPKAHKSSSFTLQMLLLHFAAVPFSVEQVVPTQSPQDTGLELVDNRIAESSRLEKTSSTTKSNYQPNIQIPPLSHIPLVHITLKYLQGWRLHRCPGQPIPVLVRPLSEVISLWRSFSSCPI